jgi:hypothetical protein
MKALEIGVFMIETKGKMNAVALPLRSMDSQGDFRACQRVRSTREGPETRLARGFRPAHSVLGIAAFIGFSAILPALGKTPALVVIDTGVSPLQIRENGGGLAGAFISEKLTKLQDRREDPHILCEDVRSVAGPMSDEHGHGTHLCGILWEELQALEENPVPALVMLKAGSRKMAPADLLKAIARTLELDAGEVRVRVLLCAFNLYPEDCAPGEFEAFEKAMRGLMDDGVWVVASAGNRGEDLDTVKSGVRSLPAGIDHPNRVVVAAANDRGLLAARSDFGVGSVWIAAPGVRVESLWPDGTRKALSGSSQAAAVVAARLFHEAKAHPDEDLEAICKRVEAKAKRHPSLLQTIGSGRFLPRAGGVAGVEAEK